MTFRRWFDTRAGAKDSAPPLTDQEAEILRKVAAKVVEWKMTVPAIIFLESVKPLNYIGAQAMVFFEPFVQTLFNFKDYDTFRELMERRESIERLLLKIEELDAEALVKEKKARRERRAARGRRRWWPFGKKAAPTADAPEKPDGNA